MKCKRSDGILAPAAARHILAGHNWEEEQIYPVLLVALHLRLQAGRLSGLHPHLLLAA
ncbi:hypothetical protein [Streptomyces sp. NPDC057909]|uniref:hypothetical protein n=1 Tax=Streptomyces sp. NPDC057909 TaxID=3346277 RepID=UPI0036E4DAC9